MKTGIELIKEIAECSAFIIEHPMSNSALRAAERREVLRKELAELPDLTFS